MEDRNEKKTVICKWTFSTKEKNHFATVLGAICDGSKHCDGSTTSSIWVLQDLFATVRNTVHYYHPLLSSSQPISINSGAFILNIFYPCLLHNWSKDKCLRKLNSVGRDNV